MFGSSSPRVTPRAGILLFAAIGTLAAAAAHSTVPSAHVRSSDLDLATAHGRKILDRRIRATADRLCLADAAGSLAKQRIIAMCVRQAIASAADARARAIENALAYRATKSPPAIAHASHAMPETPHSTAFENQH